MNPVRITFLGTGDAFCAAGHHQASYIIQGSCSTILLDCGMTTLAAIKKYGIEAAAIDAIVLSHFHGDHFGGVPSLLLQYKYLQARKSPLVIAGPPGVEERTTNLSAAMYQDSLRELPFRLSFIEMEPQKQFAIGTAQVYAFSVSHTHSDLSLGLAIWLDGRKVLYSGDTRWDENLVAHAQGADLFICECSYYDTKSAAHIDYKHLSQVRDRLAAKRLVLTHLGEEVFAHRDEVEIEMAEDGMQICL